MPVFAVGQRVKCIDRGGIAWLVFGREYVVSEFEEQHWANAQPERRAGLRVVDPDNGNWAMAKRFEAVEEAPRAIQVGDNLRVIRGTRRLQEGAIMEVKKISAMYFWFEIEGALHAFYKDRFEPVVAPAKPAKRVFKTGDKLICKEEVEIEGFYWAQQMKDTIENKTILTVTTALVEDLDEPYNGHVRVKFDGNLTEFIYPRESLVFADTLRGEDGIPVQEKPKAPNPVVSLLDKLMKEAKGSYAICSFAYTIGREEHIVPNPACYAELRYKKGSKIVEFVNSLQNGFNNLAEDQHEAFKAYAEYVIKESPWADCFVEKPLEDVFASGVELDTNRPISQLVGACIALRQASEYPRRLTSFTYLKNKGIASNTAFLVGTMMNVDDEGNWTLTGAGQNHDVLSYNMNFEELIKFFKESYFVNNGEKAANTQCAAYNIFDSIASNGGNSFSNETRKAIQHVKVGQGWDAKEVMKDKDVMAFIKTIEKRIK